MAKVEFYSYFCNIFNRTNMQQSVNTAQGTGRYHLLAILTVAVWGTTFISTKILIENGLSPQEIFLLRFVIAYVGIWLLSPRKLLADSWKDELWFLLAGLTGGTLYFLTENTALSLTQTTNVAFIICTTPLLTTGLSLLLYRQEKAEKGLLAGSLVALAGVGMLIFNGSFVLKLSPLGDVLTLCAGVSWAVYSLIIRRLSGRYPSVFITRKVFFYGILTVLPVFAVHPFSFPAEGFLRSAVWMNLLFLSVLASLACFVAWNVVLKRLGTIQSSNYLYLNPLFTTVAAHLFLQEQLTVYAVVGVLLVLGGVFVAARKG